MGVIKFIFVLLLLIPLAIGMYVIINNLLETFANSKTSKARSERTSSERAANRSQYGSSNRYKTDSKFKPKDSNHKHSYDKKGIEDNIHRKKNNPIKLRAVEDGDKPKELSKRQRRKARKARKKKEQDN